jgi:hypothetical protein
MLLGAGVPVTKVEAFSIGYSAVRPVGTGIVGK